MKKIFTSFLTVMAFISFGFAMASDTTEKDTHPTHCKHHTNKDISMNVYAKADSSSEVLFKMKPNSEDRYTIFYCNDGKTWCEIVKQNDGSTGWVSLEEMKLAEEEYARVSHKHIMFENMVKLNQEQNARIANLEQEITTLKQQLSSVLTTQQQQINQLQRAYY